MDVPDSSFATGRRSHTSAILSMSLSVMVCSRTGLPVFMHSVYGVPDGYRSNYLRNRLRANKRANLTRRAHRNAALSRHRAKR